VSKGCQLLERDNKIGRQVCLYRHLQLHTPLPYGIGACANNKGDIDCKHNVIWSQPLTKQKYFFEIIVKQ